ncbi:C40 family peptidase [Streptomyces sp. NRRL F-5727]|uniref:C40 family peptidase n=1 Tax=Streptomyces sp. NRRL F-5727 TaxID=1463871 RepID=UPI0004C8BFAD|nr:C40 family peptidase [Streptomyces sp. NRRL F-5727]
MKGIAAAIGALCLPPLLLAGTAVVAAAGGSSAVTVPSCTTAPVDTAAVQQQVAAVLAGSGAKGSRVEGLELPDEQIPHARTIVATGIDLGVPERGQVVALATAIQESRLRNLSYGDRDSLGLFQQRPSQGWGTPAQIRDPAYASKKFYEGLLKVSGWQQMTITQAAQAVQRSGFPDAYAQWEPLARALQQALVTALHAPDGSAGGTPAQQPADSCEPQTGGAATGPIPEGTVPKGYTIPADADPRAKTALDWAMHQLGTPYQWGGSCTDAHGQDPLKRCDCSSLTQQSYKEAGIALTRVSQTQAHEGRAVSLTQLRPGDLLFSRGTKAAPEHVGLYAGHGLVIEAPRTGRNVRFSTLADYAAHSARRVL